MKIKNKNILLIVAVISLGLLVSGGTYAWLTYDADVDNGEYDATSTCFLIDYDEGEEITGTLFQSSTPKGGLSGTVSMNINSSCDVDGVGTITINVDSGTDSILFSEGALKYAVYEDTTADPVSTGTITSSGDVTLYSGFVLSKTAKTYYIYIWLDGTIADNDYKNLSFAGNIHASATSGEQCTIIIENEYGRDIFYKELTIISGQSIVLSDDYKTYFNSKNWLECYEKGDEVQISCNTLLLASESPTCWG